MHRSHKRHSSSFTKFVARLQNKGSSKNVKSSTLIIEQPSRQFTNSISLPTFSKRFHLSQILYNPSHPIEYLSEIEEKQDSDSLSSDGINSISDHHHHNNRLNLSQMNVSMDNIFQQQSPQKLLKLPNSLDTVRLHSTAIFE